MRGRPLFPGADFCAGQAEAEAAAVGVPCAWAAVRAPCYVRQSSRFIAPIAFDCRS